MGMLVLNGFGAGLCLEIGRTVEPAPDHPKRALHSTIVAVLRDHLKSLMTSLENAQRRYCGATRPGTLSFKEWTDLCRLLGLNLGEHFWSHMNKRVRLCFQ
jgi:hypothetical protein